MVLPVDYKDCLSYNGPRAAVVGNFYGVREKLS
jgi:hypothetical protein